MKFAAKPAEAAEQVAELHKFRQNFLRTLTGPCPLARDIPLT